MEAKELRIGNYIYMNDEIDIICEIGQANNGFCENGGYFNFGKGAVKPIPLSEEILLRLDWGGYIHYSINSSFKIDKHGRLYYNNDYAGVNFKHLHELQNLYYSLTGKELTLNKLT